MSTTEVKGLNPQQAFEMLKNEPRAVLVDVRSSMEFLFVGHPAGAVHVAWIDEPDWDINPHFVTQVKQLMLGGISHTDHHTSAPVLLICRSGKRSEEAAEYLLKAGMTDVYNVLDGFEGELNENHHRSSVGGWRFSGLPWEQC
jgi:rhodanese-related sulfurtransferase